MIAYLVNGKSFNNIYLALYESFKTRLEIKFYCYDHEYDQHDWTIEPETSFDQLMSEFAWRLRNRYERLILLWSGGTDSHTIYNIFRTNQIPIDEIIVKVDKGSKTYPEANFIWMNRNHWDKKTIITKLDEFDNDFRIMDIKNEDWVWSNKGHMIKHGMNPIGDAVRFHCEKNHAGHNWRAISGYEKSRLIYENNKWHARQLNVVLEPCMGYDYFTHFFLEPTIAIKQSHLVKKAVKKQIQFTKQPLYDKDWAETKWPKTEEGYQQWSAACGRHGEVNSGTSFLQKNNNNNMLHTILDPAGDIKKIFTNGNLRLQNDIEASKKSAIYFVKGLHNLKADHLFMNFLKDNNWFKENEAELTNLKFISSKKYCLGE